jgi:hypothetical protein
MLFMVIERFEGNDPRVLQQWALEWRGYGVTFEFLPVVPSKDTREVVAPFIIDG